MNVKGYTEKMLQVSFIMINYIKYTKQIFYQSIYIMVIQLSVNSIVINVRRS